MVGTSFPYWHTHRQCRRVVSHRCDHDGRSCAQHDLHHDPPLPDGHGRDGQPDPTTYSTFNYESLEYLRGAAIGIGLLNIAATLLGCIIAGLVGLAAGEWLIAH